MRNLFLVLISLIFTASCEKSKDLSGNDLFSGRPEVPATDSLDVNSDQIADFVISYREFATNDEPSSGGSIIGSINPLHQNQLLYRNAAGYLFLEINDTIRTVSDSNSEWNGYGADVISIDRDSQDWDSTWTVISDKNSFYFLAYKLVINNSERIGWISLTFDTMTGEISISDGDYTDNSELIIYIL